MMKKKFKKVYLPIVYREKKAERQSVEAFVSRKKGQEWGSPSVTVFTKHTLKPIFLTSECIAVFLWPNDSVE